MYRAERVFFASRGLFDGGGDAIGGRLRAICFLFNLQKLELIWVRFLTYAHVNRGGGGGNPALFVVRF